MSTSTLNSGTGANAPDGRRDIARGFKLARRWQQQGKWREAEQVYGSILTVEPKHFGSLCGLGAVYKQQGRRAEAVALFRRAAAAAPESADIHTDLGVIFANLDQPQEAIACFENALAANPGHAETHNHLGNALRTLGRSQEAIAHHARALAINPDFAQAHCDLGVVFAALDRRDAAIACYRHALVLKSDHAEAHCHLGDLLGGLGRHDEAVSHFARALAIRPGLARAHCGLGILIYELVGPHAAIVHFEQALAAQPDLVEAQLRLGNIFERLNRLEEAIACYRRTLALSPNRAAAHHRLGIVLQALDRHDEAIAHYEAVASARPNDASVCLGLALALQKLDRFEASIGWAKKALALDPRNAQAHHAMGAALQALGDLKDAGEAYAAAVALAPRDAVFHLSLARLKPFTDNDPRLSALEGLAEDFPSLAADEQIALHFALGKAYADRERHQQAFHHLREGNALKRAGITYDEAATLGQLERLRETFTSDLMRTTGGGAASRLPVFVIGMPRSGTTLVEQILASHSQVFAAGERDDFRRCLSALMRSKGTAQLADLLPTLTAEDYRQVAAGYLDRIKAGAPAALRIVDKMPSNFAFAGLIHLALPQARIIHVCRDPVDTCVSCFSVLFSGEPSSPVYDLGELGRYYRAYARLIEHWRTLLPEGVMLDVRYEDMVEDLEAVARQMLAHCGLDWEDGCLAFDRTKRAVTSASAIEVRQPIYRHAVGRWRRYANELGPLLEALEIPVAKASNPSGRVAPDHA
ncbi:MAG TPA: tetratricopeptide repeat protein [Xanthobacteraceae bacterium]|nr:tetratricopeptide repeat protein [Xanthobacteraceae bacterium]